MTYKCFRCHNTIVGKRWTCKSCRHGYCQDCYLTYHWHTPEQNFTMGHVYGGSGIRI